MAREHRGRAGGGLSPPAATPSAPAPSARARWGFPLILAGLTMLGPFTIDTAFPAFGQIERDFGVDEAATQQLVSTYLVTFGLMSVLHGPLSDALGRKRVITGGLVLYGLASLGCALAPSMGMLLLFRTVQGLSAGGSVIVSRTIVADLYEGPQAQRLMSTVMMIFGVAPAVAPIVGGLLLQLGPWQLIFWFLTALAAALLGASMLLPETHPAERRTPLRLRPLVRGLVTIAATPRFLRIGLAAACAFAAFFTYIGAAAIFVVDLLGQGETDFWKFFVPLIAGMTLGSWLSGRAAGRISSTRLVSLAMAAGLVAALVNLALALLPATQRLPWAVVGPSLLAFAVMSGYPTVQLTLLHMFPAARGSATSVATVMALVLNAVMAGLVAPWVTASLATMAVAALVLMSVGCLLWLWHLRT